MTNPVISRDGERGGAGVKFLFAAVALVLLANAGYHYVPVAYEGASFRQEMDTAVVKGLASVGRVKPADIVAAHIQNAAKNNNLPEDALIEITPTGKSITATATYTKQIDMLPFGLYKYKYQFNHTATPTGYLANDQ